MEDLWKDITLSTLSSSSSSSPHTVFLEFLARARPLSTSSKNILFSASASAAASISPQTILTLNNPDFHRLADCNSVDNTSSSAKRDGIDLSSSSSMYSCDRKHERMIKNRDSAARSRARKKAYTAELELEVAQLKQENARLRMEQEIRNRTAVDQSPKKHKLHRTSSAPF